MRKQFIKTLSELAEKDSRIILLVADVGFSFIEDFAQKFPNQFVNCGVIEQTMMGLAAGLALTGWKPYFYSMIPFSVMRCYEQLRNDTCYNKANVKIIGIRGSVHYKFLGFSHNIADDEDKKILKHLPNLGCCFPKTPEEVKTVMIEAYKLETPVYIRL